jgi:hypothetical protein
MDPITIRWMIVGELVVAVLFGALLFRPDAWVYWRPLVGLGLAAFVLVPLGAGLYLARVDRKARSSTPVNRVEHT